MGFIINGSTPSKTAREMRKDFEEQGFVEATDQAEADRLEAEGKIPFIDYTNSEEMPMPSWLKTRKGKKLFESIFQTAELPEVAEKDLLTGKYTNLQIAMRFDDPMRLSSMLATLANESLASKRSILSMAVDLI